ncbi:MAG TPA: TIGR01212 family radical SAM protein, partial [bacterium]|nr:TIGR01212 family radical SAM protein [bacterium]
ESPLYRSLNRYLQERFGQRVYKVTIDAGFTCPNRDGTIGTGGCIYCNNQGFSPATALRSGSVGEQIASGVERLRRRYGATKFLAYFQPFTNTYAPVDELKSRYEQALQFPEVVGMCIGTRPDCVADEVLSLLQSYAQHKEIWLEYGLQTIHDRTLALIQRGHDFKTFLNTLERTRNRGIRICVHVILGLPGETLEMMMETIDAVAQMGVQGIKFHVLHVLCETPLEQMYQEGNLLLLSEDAYVSLVSDSLERLPADMVIHRLASDAPREWLVAPEWCLHKNQTISKIQQGLMSRGTGQGCRRQ